jgi:hypothetical protein
MPTSPKALENGNGTETIPTGQPDGGTQLSPRLGEQLIAPCSSFERHSRAVTPDIPSLLNRLLIFENFYLQTIRFKEFDGLVRRLGFENVFLLLDSGALKLDLNPTQFAQTGQTAQGLAIRDKPPLPLLSYSFSLLRTHPYYNHYVVRCLGEVHRSLGDFLDKRKLMRLEEAILRALMPLHEDVGVESLLALHADLKSNSPILRKSVALHLRLRRNLVIPDSDIALTLHPIDDTDFATESNLQKFGFSTEEIHSILESSLLAVGGVNSRIEEMKNYNALSGAIEDEFPLFFEKFSFLAPGISSKGREGCLNRVVQIGRLPSFKFVDLTKNFNVPRFLEVRRSGECAAFRKWLASAEEMSDTEIRVEVNTLKARLGTLAHTETGKAVRFVLCAGAGLVPHVGLGLGLALGALDMFILDRFLPASGPRFFLNHCYKSVFDEK